MHRWTQEPGRSHKVLFRCPALHVSVTAPVCWLVRPSQRDTVGGLAPDSLCLRSHQPNPGVPRTFTHHRNCTINTGKQRKTFYILNSKAYPIHQRGTGNPSSALVEGGCTGWPVPGESARVCSCRTLEPCQVGATCLSKGSSLKAAWHPAWAGS